MIKVYTAGYMTSVESDRFDWRNALMEHCHSCDIQWLNPAVPDGAIVGQGDPLFYSPRDILQVKNCDVLFAFIDLAVAKSLGTTFEMGMAFAWQKRIIMVDMSPDMHSLDFNRTAADAVWPNLLSGAEALKFVAKGFE